MFISWFCTRGQAPENRDLDFQGWGLTTVAPVPGTQRASCEYFIQWWVVEWISLIRLDRAMVSEMSDHTDTRTQTGMHSHRTKGQSADTVMRMFTWEQWLKSRLSVPGTGLCPYQHCLGQSLSCLVPLWRWWNFHAHLRKEVKSGVREERDLKSDPPACKVCDSISKSLFHLCIHSWNKTLP